MHTQCGKHITVKGYVPNIGRRTPQLHVRHAIDLGHGDQQVRLDEAENRFGRKIPFQDKRNRLP